jgi:L-iditol 2-dehydrogenase
VAGALEPYAITAHCLVERGRLSTGQSVLISGAATMGLMATIWAARLGADPIIVAGTDTDAPLRLPLAGEVGATHTVNVQHQDLRHAVLDATGGDGVDVWIECSGSPAAITSGLGLVNKTGRAILIGLVGPETISIPWNTLLYKELDLVGCFSSPPSSWEKALAAAGDDSARLRRLVTDIIPLEDWESAFERMRRGEGVKILVDMEA